MNRRAGKPPHRRNHIRLRLPIGQHSANLICGPVPRRSQKRSHIFRSQLRREQTHRRQMKIAVTQGRQELGIPPRRARRRDPLVGNRLREAQYSHTVGEHRRAALAKIEPPLIDFREMRDQIGLEFATAVNQIQQPREQLIARKSLQSTHRKTTSRGHAG
jgi:hypothetical protein